MTQAIPLRELEGELTSLPYKDGPVLTGVMFLCPNPRCARGHSQWIPYSDTGGDQTIGGSLVRVWKREGGDTIDTITLSPSIVVATCDGLHGHIRSGAWHPC